MSSSPLHTLPPVIVGAGPAGIRAAQTLAKHGLSPVVLDEGLRAGGQIYRRQPAGFERPAKALYGFEVKKAQALHDTFDALAAHIDYRPETLVWNAEPGLLDLYHMPSQSSRSLPWRDVILATGATDRILPVPGWTLPGVYSLGGAQVALKFQGCTVGGQVVLAGTGPLLYLVAYQYLKAGAKVLAVLDQASLTDQIKALPAMSRQPSVLLKGAYYVAVLQAHGVRIVRHARLTRVLGNDHVSGVCWTDARSSNAPEEQLACEALAFGYALRSETQLADVLGCRFEYSELQRSHLPVRDACTRSSVPGVYLAGDGSGIRGADAAEITGELAALALLTDRHIPVSSARIALLQTQVAQMDTFRTGLEAAFPFPADWARHVPDETVICRCENVTAGELRHVVSITGAKELNRLKALSRIGMGRCQGRMCGVAAAELLAHACDCSVAQVGRLRAQVPIKPIPAGLTVPEEASVQ